MSGPSRRPGNPFCTLDFFQKKNNNPLFEYGTDDYGDGIEDLAEDGEPSVLDGSLINHPKVRSKGVFNTHEGVAGPAPIFPGDSYVFIFSAKQNDNLNFATMFIQSNDLFVGPYEEGIILILDKNTPLSDDITSYLTLWDTGTEVNEDPWIGPNQAPRQNGPDKGPSENGVVKPVHDWYTYQDVKHVFKVTIIPLNW